MNNIQALAANDTVFAALLVKYALGAKLKYAELLVLHIGSAARKNDASCVK